MLRPNQRHRPLRVSVPSRVYTLRQAARILGETMDAAYEGAMGMLSAHGSIRVIDEDFAEADWPLATAFTEEGIEHLRFLIDQSRRNLS
jgi:hypothetical protein